jgi:HEAT repeat protein
MNLQRLVVSLLCVLVSTLVGAVEHTYTVTVDVTRDIHALGKDDLLKEDPARRRLAALGDAAVPVLEDALRTEPSAVRAGVVEVLSEIGTRRTIEPLLGAARDESAPVRAAALEGLRDQHDTRIDAVMAHALEDGAAEVRIAAIHGCANRCRETSALERLIDIAIHDPEPVPASHARALVRQILAGGGTDRASTAGRIAATAPPLLVQPPTAEAVRAALLLSDIGRTDGLAVLGAAVGRADLRNLPLQAIVALGDTGDATAVAPLSRALGVKDPTMQMYAAASLETLARRAVPGAAEALRAYEGPRVSGGKVPPPP